MDFAPTGMIEGVDMADERDITYPVAVRDDEATGEIIFAGETGAILVPSGTTAQRPADPVNGMIRYNETLETFEGYANDAWGPIAGGGGGDTSAPTMIETDDEYTVLDADTFIGWNSDTLAPKTLNIGAPTGPKQVTVKDAAGDADAYNITITGDGCTIDGAATFVMDVNFQSVTLKWDGTSNWMVT